ncbi:pyridoxal phosphate-dependent aminotransferase [Nitratireductor aquimarinus]|uniref:pyridoxal phosphate-dependent aminotransferase n=1 Tax=Nitratireductor aquimarinus TaxID=889300 RepID=UPI001A8D9893|nr:pyridoxal phosphate-dependent aminotransferase [Nitratireductor aquimarinus]MBN8241925.1 pyridoxal phosphate-dependent aminotransferase [Nitratireductor aquimarinus]MBY6130311.1 pyridoxal phosphate-dependent aminotransferase [Nitratireductor aquimarinus]MCA1302937.1 pyridoxal phosphate-dependent aminotransferase [Nitratireductor aquimarinus]
MTIRPPLTPLADSLPSTVPFVGPETQERAAGRPFRARLGANENGFGPSPKAIEAMENAAHHVWKYGDPESSDLRAALAQEHGVKPENIVVGEGIDGLLGLIARLYIEPGTPVVTSLGGYPTFNYHVVGFGGRLVPVPYSGDHENLEGLRDAAFAEKAPLVYFANPDNPMGTWWEADEVQRFIESLPETSMLILDEAYGETAPASALPRFEPDRPNVLRMRTFSKAYALAGMRCGYAIGEAQTIRAFDKIRNHFGMPGITQAASLAALQDKAYFQETLKKISASRDRIAAIAAANGLASLPSATNFVAVDCGGKAIAEAVMQGLLDRDVFVRKPATPGLDRCIRVSVGPENEMDVFEQAFAEALAAAHNQR